MAIIRKINDRKPDISIIIPCYDIEPYIDECMNSVLSQKNIKNCEVICVDDGSSDSTLKKVQKYSKKYRKFVKLIEHKRNYGVSAARNSGISAAAGNTVMFVDGDDILGGNQNKARIDTHYLEGFLDVLSSNPDAGMAVGNILMTNQTNDAPLYNQRFNKLFDRSKKKVITHSTALDFLDERISSCAVLYRAHIIQNNKISFLRQMTYFEDASFITRYAIASSKDYKRMLAVVPDNSFYMYRRRVNSAMTKLSTHSEKYMRRFERTQNGLIYRAMFQLQCDELLGSDSHIYNIAAHRYSKIKKQIHEYSKMSDAGAYKVLANYVPQFCAGCMNNRCDGCGNNGPLLDLARHCIKSLACER